MLYQGPFSAREHYYRKPLERTIPPPQLKVSRPPSQIRVSNFHKTALYPYSLSSDPRDTLETACFHHVPSVNHVCERIDEKAHESMGSGLHIVRTHDSRGIDPFGQGEGGGTFDMSLSNDNHS